MNPKISVITVVYNTVETVEKTLKSVQSQTYKNLEFVVIDGGSTDGTVAILEQYRDVISVLVSEPDDGLYAAMNKGKDLSTGDYAIFVNAGDLFVSDEAIASAAAELTDTESGYFGNTIIYFGENYKVAPDHHHQSMFFPRSFLDSDHYRTDKYKITAEGDYIYRLVDQRDVRRIDVDLVFSRIDGMRVHCYSTISGSRQIYGEVVELMGEHDSVIPMSFRLTYPLKSVMKYVAFKVGGLPLVARMLLAKYRTSARTYRTEVLP